MTGRTPRRSRMVRPTIEKSDEQERDEFWALARKAVENLDGYYFTDRHVDLEPTTFPFAEYDLECLNEAKDVMRALRESMARITAGPPLLTEGGES